MDWGLVLILLAAAVIIVYLLKHLKRALAQLRRELEDWHG